MTIGGWTRRRIEEVADVVGGGTPATRDAGNFGGDIAWITPKDLSGLESRYIGRGERSISRAGLDSSSARLMPRDTVLLSTRAPVGLVALAANGVTTNQGCRSLVLHDGNDSRFFYYLLKAHTELLVQHANGTTFMELAGSTLRRLEFEIPPLDEQRAIADVLWSVDDRTESNLGLVRSVELLARELYVAMTNGRPSRRVRLSDVASVTRGVSYRSADLAASSSTALFSLKAFRRTGGFQRQGLKPFVGQAKPAQNLSPGDVAVAVTDLTQNADVVGRAVRVPRDSEFDRLIASMDVTIVRPAGNEVTAEVLYAILSGEEFREYCRARANGTTVLHLATKAIPEFEFNLPGRGDIEAFTDQAAVLWALHDHLLLETATLEECRDALMPALVRGEVRVETTA